MQARHKRMQIRSGDLTAPQSLKKSVKKYKSYLT